MWIEQGIIIAIALSLTLYGQTFNTAELKFSEAVHKEQVQGDLAGAIKLYQAVAASDNRPLAAKALVSLGRCYEKQGSAEARKAYEKVVSGFADQGEPVREARVRLAKIVGANSGKTEPIARRVTKPLESWPVRTVSRDGRYAAYVFQRRSTPMLVDLTTGIERSLGDGKLVPAGHRSHSAAISPDGSEVAFDFGDSYGSSELRVTKVGGTQAKTLYRAKGVVFLADWSRDGSKLLVGEIQSREGLFHARVIDARSGEMKLVYSTRVSTAALVRQQARGALMRFSPDGRFVAYSTRTEQSSPGSTAVFVRPIEPGMAQLVAGHRSDAYVFDWSPDGRHLLFVSDESGSYDLWALPMPDGKPAGVPRRLRKDVGEVQSSGTTDAGTIFYSVLFDTGETYIGDLGLAAGTVRGLRLLPRPKGHTDGATSWSADGEQLLINRRSQESLGTPILHDVATAQERPLETSAHLEWSGSSSSFRYALWSRDGKSVLFGTRTIPPGQSTLVLTDAQGGDVRKTFSKNDAYGFREISPDQRYVFAVRGVNELNNTRVVRIDLASGSEQEICQARPIVWALSPDASQVACGGFGDGIRVYPASGGPGRDLVKGTSFGSIEWTPEGKHILYSVGSAGPTPGYWIIPAQGGQPRKLQVDLKATGTMSLSRDGRKIAITTTGRSIELWALENALSQLK